VGEAAAKTGNHKIILREFEQLVADYHDVEFAVSFTSATAALHGAVYALGVQPGQEVIVSPYTFSSSATCALMNNAVPVFVDVDPYTFCMDPDKIVQAITPLTAAIIPVHLFGRSADMDAIMDISREYSLPVIEDAAQAPGARYKGRLTGTMGDCGILSFVGEKNASCGEGGMLITNDLEIARRARLLRNHGDCLYEPMLGYNYRMTELTAAIGAVQWARIDERNDARRELVYYLNGQLDQIPGLSVTLVEHGSLHSYYVYALRYDEAVTGVPRGWFVEALNAEGVPFGAGYVRPLYLSPLYQQQAHYAFAHYQGHAEYYKGLCPVAEYLYERGLILTMAARPPATTDDMDDIVKAIDKVLAHGH